MMKHLLFIFLILISNSVLAANESLLKYRITKIIENSGMTNDDKKVSLKCDSKESKLIIESDHLEVVLDSNSQCRCLESIFQSSLISTQNPLVISINLQEKKLISYEMH